MNKGISVIICCYNSADRIGATLKHLEKQDFSGPWEVIVVDNNCNDLTIQVVRSVWTNTIPITICEERLVGLSHARNRGVRMAKYDLILFCDDDNWLSENYLSTAAGFMMSNPQVGVVGGMNEAVFDSEEPVWWKEKAGGYAVGSQAPDSGDITHRRFVWGAGMVLRKKLVTDLYLAGFKSMLSDRAGHVLSSGGDSEICRWAILQGFKLWYLKELTLKHFIPAGRLSVDYLNRLTDGHREASKLLNWYDFVIDGFGKEPREPGIFHRFLGLIFALRAQFFYDEIRLASAQLRVGHWIKIHPVVFAILRVDTQLRRFGK